MVGSFDPLSKTCSLNWRVLYLWMIQIYFRHNAIAMRQLMRLLMNYKDHWIYGKALLMHQEEHLTMMIQKKANGIVLTMSGTHISV